MKTIVHNEAAPESVATFFNGTERRPANIPELIHRLRKLIEELEGYRDDREFRDACGYRFPEWTAEKACRYARHLGVPCRQPADLLNSIDALNVVGEILAECIERCPAEVPNGFKAFPDGSIYKYEDELTEYDERLTPTTLRDARYRKEVHPGKIGRHYVYTVDDVLQLIDNTRGK
jgi:hypothetical protein